MTTRPTQDDAPTGTHWCENCGNECEVVPVDEGIGAYEFWGARGTHHDWQWKSGCCGAGIVDHDPNDPHDDE